MHFPAVSREQRAARPGDQLEVLSGRIKLVPHYVPGAHYPSRAKTGSPHEEAKLVSNLQVGGFRPVFEKAIILADQEGVERVPRHLLADGGASTLGESGFPVDSRAKASSLFALWQR